MSQVRTNAILDASGGNTATINTVPLRPGVLDPENRIINGAFDFWQRGTSSTSSGYVAADRWSNGLSGGTVTQSRQSFTVGDMLGSSTPAYFYRQSVSGQTLSSQYANTGQPIESVRSYAGQTITVLGWAKRSSGSGNIAISLRQFFGTGGSPSSAVDINGQTVTLTGSWAPFALTYTVPSISGKTLGTNNNDFLNLQVWTSAGSDYNARTNSLGLQTIGVDLWGIHIKVGTHTTAACDLYKQPELGPELARCQRYFTIIDHSAYAAIFAVWKTTSPFNMQNISYFPQTMRAAPSIANYGSETWYNVGTQAYSNGLITGSQASNSFVQTSMEPSPATVATGYEAIFVRFKVSADAEL